jgi:hypothetical protein
LEPDPDRRAGYADRYCFGYMEVEKSKIRFLAVDSKGRIVDDVVLRDEDSPRGLKLQELHGGR